MKKKILVVENDREIRNILSYILQDEGYAVETLQDIDQLLAVARSYQPDAVLLDIIMPGINDTEVCKTLKKSEGLTHIPLIVISTHPTVAATIKEICADEVISKPFDISNLLDVISDQLAA